MYQVYSYLIQCSTLPPHSDSLESRQACVYLCEHCIECYTEDEVRLVAGSVPREGRVEYCKNGLWGSICRNSWDEKDAQVVCTQLGYGK